MCTGNPWVLFVIPIPVSIKICTHMHGHGFLGRSVLTYPQVYPLRVTHRYYYLLDKYTKYIYIYINTKKKQRRSGDRRWEIRIGRKGKREERKRGMRGRGERDMLISRMNSKENMMNAPSLYPHCVLLLIIIVSPMSYSSPLSSCHHPPCHSHHLVIVLSLLLSRHHHPWHGSHGPLLSWHHLLILMLLLLLLLLLLTPWLHATAICCMPYMMVVMYVGCCHIFVTAVGKPGTQLYGYGYLLGLDLATCTCTCGYP
jgi:hypothetical protein